MVMRMTVMDQSVLVLLLPLYTDYYIRAEPEELREEDEYIKY